MQVVNFATVSVDTTGVEILSSAQATAAVTAGMIALAVNPSVDIVIVDASQGSAWANIPNAVAGSVANSPFVCPAGSVTMINHKGGAVRAISTSGTATVKRALSMVP